MTSLDQRAEGEVVTAGAARDHVNHLFVGAREGKKEQDARWLERAEALMRYIDQSERFRQGDPSEALRKACLSVGVEASEPRVAVSKVYDKGYADGLGDAGDPSDTARLDWLLSRRPAPALTHDDGTVYLAIGSRMELDAAMSKQGGEDANRAGLADHQDGGSGSAELADEHEPREAGAGDSGDAGQDSRRAPAKAEAEAVTPDRRGDEIAVRIDEDSLGCQGCIHRWWVQADPMGMSRSGWGCKRSGGHAITRCEHYEIEADPDLPDEGASEREGEPPLRDQENFSEEGPLSDEEVETDDLGGPDEPMPPTMRARIVVLTSRPPHPDANPLLNLLDEIDATITRLQGENERLKEDVQTVYRDLNEALNDSEATVKRLEGENADLRRERDALLQDRNEALRSCDLLGDEKREAEREREALAKSKNSTLIAAMEGRIQTLEAERDNFAADCDTLASERDALNTQLQEAQAIVSAAEEFLRWHDRASLGSQESVYVQNLREAVRARSQKEDATQRTETGPESTNV